jgi:hypothetical protein
MVAKRLLVLLGALVIPATLLLAPVALLSGTADAATVDAVPAASSLPPSARKDLVAIFGPQVRKFGLRVTRAALVDAEQKRDPHGTHLAIYVEPTGEYTPQDYVDGTVDVTRVFLPSVFARWKGLRSFDVCQEPRPVVDDRASPPPETQVFATRAGSRKIDWSTTDVATLVSTSDQEAASAGAARPVAFSLYVAAHLLHTPAYQEAVGTGAGAATPAPPTTYEYG